MSPAHCTVDDSVFQAGPAALREKLLFESHRLARATQGSGKVTIPEGVQEHD